MSFKSSNPNIFLFNANKNHYYHNNKRKPNNQHNKDQCQNKFGWRQVIKRKKNFGAKLQCKWSHKMMQFQLQLRKSPESLQNISIIQDSNDWQGGT